MASVVASHTYTDTTGFSNKKQVSVFDTIVFVYETNQSHHFYINSSLSLFFLCGIFIVKYVCIIAGNTAEKKTDAQVCDATEAE